MADKQIVELNPTHRDECVDQILEVLGTKVETEQDGDYTYYEFPNSRASLVICGDDAWGVVIGAYVHDGHLVLIGHYGDDGVYHFSPTIKQAREDGKDCHWINTCHEGNISVLMDMDEFLDYRYSIED